MIQRLDVWINRSNQFDPAPENVDTFNQFQKESMMTKRRCFLSLFLSLISIGSAFAHMPASKTGDAFDPIHFLVGDWIGEGSSKSSQGMGSFSFKEDLGGSILVRRDHTDYPTTSTNPAFSLDVLMIIYTEAGRLRATYLDSEKHTIQYTAQSIIPGTSVQFVSGQAPGAPTFRLTYTKTSSEKMNVKFELAPRGKPDSFSTYAEGSASRKGGD